MQEEIKEILNNTLEYLEGIDETRNTKILTTNETNILLDYITNLQDKVEWYENIEINKTIDKFRLEYNKQIKRLNKEKEDYKLRNEKAIEYIELGLANEEEAEELLNILQGVDKE